MADPKTNQIPPGEEAEGAPKRSRVRRFFDLLRLLFRWTRIGLELIILILTAFVVGVLATSTGTLLGLRLGLDIYNDMIPGEIVLGDVEGSILGGFSLIDVEARDAQGRAIAAFKRLDLDYTPVMGVFLKADVDRLNLDSPQVHLYERKDGTSAFLDLAPVGDDTPEAPKPPEPPAEPGFSLPLGVDLTRLNVTHATVVDHRMQPELIYAQDVSLSLAAKGRGPKSIVTLSSLTGSSPVVDAVVYHALFSVGWEKTDAVIYGLEIDTNYGRVVIDSARFNPWTFDSLVELEAKASRKVLSRLLGRNFPGAKVALSASGNPDGFVVKATVDSGDAQVVLDTTGSLMPVMSASATFSVLQLDPSRFGLPAKGALSFNGQASTSGDSLQTLVASAKLNCTSCRLSPLGEFSLMADATLERQKVAARLDLQAAGTSVEVVGDMRNFDTVNARFKAKSPDLAAVTEIFLQDPLSGSLLAQGVCQGSIRTPDCEIEVQASELRIKEMSLASVDLDASCTLGSDGLTFSGTIEAREFSGAGQSISSARVQVGGSTERIKVNADVRIQEGRRLRTDLALYPGPPLAFRLAGLSLDWDTHKVDLLKPSRITLRDDSVDIEGLLLAVDNAELGLDGLFAPEAQSDLALSLEGFQLASLAAVLPEPALAGTVSISASLKGNGDNPHIRLEVVADGLGVDDTPVGDLDLTLVMEKQQTTLRFDMDDGDLPLVRVNAVAPVDVNLRTGGVDWIKKAQHQLSYRLTNLNSERLASLIDLPEDLGFSLAASGEVGGTPVQFEATTAVEGEFQFGKLDPQPYRMVIEANQDHQKARVQFVKPGPFPFRVEASAQAQLGALFDGQQVDIKMTPIAADLEFEPLPMEMFSVYLPNSLNDLAGAIAADLSVAGTLGAPEFAGWLEIQNAKVYVLNMAQPFHGINMRLEADNHRLKLAKLEVRSGSGHLSASGDVTAGVDSEMDGRLTADLKRFLLEFPGTPQMILDSSLQMSVAVRADAVRVDARISNTVADFYTTFTKAPKDIPANVSVTFVSDDLKQKSASQSEANIDFRPLILDIKLDDPILVRGDMLDMEWEGALLATIDGRGADLSGEFTMTRGRFDFLGNDFTVESASLNFAPGASNIPFLSLASVASLPEASVFLTLKGRATSPDLVLRSNPPMPEYQVFTLLVTGTAETSNESSDAVQGKAANLGTGLIAYKYPQLQQQLRQRTGIDRVAVSFGETAEEPIVTVGKRVTRRLYIETKYHHNAPQDVNRVEARVEIQLVPRWTLETFYGDSNVGGIDIFWHMRFGEKREPTSQASDPAPSTRPESSSENGEPVTDQ
jgi:autotransporter translocation and assembly factor TamB